jgi:hypothetical protein
MKKKNDKSIEFEPIAGGDVGRVGSMRCAAARSILAAAAAVRMNGIATKSPATFADCSFCFLTHRLNKTRNLCRILKVESFCHCRLAA